MWVHSPAFFFFFSPTVLFSCSGSEQTITKKKKKKKQSTCVFLLALWLKLCTPPPWGTGVYLPLLSFSSRGISTITDNIICLYLSSLSVPNMYFSHFYVECIFSRQLKWLQPGTVLCLNICWKCTLKNKRKGKKKCKLTTFVYFPVAHCLCVHNTQFLKSAHTHPQF